MKIDRRFLHYKNRATFEEDLRDGNIPQSAIVFVDEGRTIYTHGEEYAGDYKSLLELEYIKKDDASEQYLSKNLALLEYAKKEDIPEIPKNISEFLNDVGYLTQHLSLSDYALKTDIPEIPTNISAFANDVGYLTLHQDLSNYALKSDIPAEQDLSIYLKANDAEGLYAKKGDIPTTAAIQFGNLIGKKIANPNDEYGWKNILVDDSFFDINGDGSITIGDITAATNLNEYALGFIADYAKKHYNKEYVEKGDYSASDETARSLAQEAKDKADLAYTKAEDAEDGLSSKQDKLTAGDGIIIQNNTISLRDVSDGVNSMEALISSIEEAFRLFLNALRGLFVLRKEVYNKDTDFGDGDFEPINVRIAFPYFYVVQTTLCAENTPPWEDYTFIVPENACEVLDDLLILY